MFYYYGVHLVTFVPGADGKDPWESIHIDTIDRFNQGSAGSGNVYIAHSDQYPTEDDVHILETPFFWPSEPAFGSHLDPTGAWPRLYECAAGSGRMYALWERSDCVDIAVSHVVYDPDMSRTMGKAYGKTWNRTYRYKCTFEEASSYVHKCFTALEKTDFWYAPLYDVKGYVSKKSDVNLAQTSQLDSYLASRELGLQSYHRSGIDNALFYKAYYAAIDKLPVLEQNTFANIVDVVKTIRSFADGLDFSDFRSIKQVSRDLWLRYRYQYSTTVGDMEEVSNAVARLQGIMGKPISTYGGASKDGVSVTCQVKIKIPEVVSVDTFLKDINLRPTLANAWDVLPYSFVVDWFFRVGPFLEDLQKWIDSPTADIQEIWYSVWQSKHDKDSGLMVREYGRWMGDAPALPYFTSSHTRSETIGLRAADAVALII